MKSFILLISLFTLQIRPLKSQTIPSPQDFLGYELGSTFTYHWQIVEYVKTVAAQSDRVDFKQIGTSYEGRPLVLLYISSPENLQRKTAIQENNLNRAQLKEGVADASLPAIVWLSYNVHGNEAVSSEAAMKTLYELATTTDAQKLSWLQNVFIIMDPCLNPDGRERYVTSYRQILGTQPDADPNSWEHDFSWASGRTNHYFFDLNRDWAWMTQKETQIRIAEYHQWMPQIHVDFHEQGYNEPYYFAPAAEPLHEAITSFQRDFQVEIGKNHARYFDQNNWLFFTRQYFDLFYPSYGDSWPIFNGAIGMTYEQGGINAGLAVKTETGDTLTLKQRIEHHYTTGLSTVEIASLQKQRLNQEFEAYFKKAVSNPEGAFKSYIIKKSDSEAFVKCLEFLQNQGIQLQRAPENRVISGYDYFKDDSDRYKTQKGDVLIDAYQPKSTLIRVLFDPKPALSDSITYDITAWALPWVYGVSVIASNQRISGGTTWESEKVLNRLSEQNQAFIFKWDSFEDARFLADLLKHGIKTRASERKLTIQNKSFPSGSVLILKSDNPSSDFLTKLEILANQHGIELTPIQSGYIEKGVDLGSADIHFITPPNIAVLTNSPTNSMSVGEIWHFFDQQLGYQVHLLDVGNLSSKSISQYDVLILPSGNYSSVMSESVLSRLKEWTRNGGTLIAMGTANQWLADQTGFGSIKTKKNKTTDSVNTRSFAERERNQISSTSPGAFFKHRIDNTHPLGYGFDGFLFSLRLQDSDFEMLQDGWNVVSARKEDHISGFIGFKALENLDKTLVYGNESYGRGQIVYLTQNPLFRAFLYQNKLLMANAIFHLGQTR